MKRRDFLKSTGVLGGGLLAGSVASRAQVDRNPVSGKQPNILFILVDELRYPTVFPGNIKTPGQFLANYMPNLHRLIWRPGVKFGNYYTAANACTPSRGTIITGLYSQQSWLLTTILSKPNPSPIAVKLQPQLNTAYPTYGKLLQKAGYTTPYRGKWHVSIPVESMGGLTDYGFDYGTSVTGTYPDPTGSNLQGTYGDAANGYLNDAFTASQAVNFLEDRKASDAPWCLTVGFVNPHDREFFPAGTEFQTVTELFNSNANPTGAKQFTDYSVKGPRVDWDTNQLKSPTPYGYPTVPPNWESQQDLKDHDKPTSHTFIRQFSAGEWGGVTDDPSKNTPQDRTVIPYPDKDPSQPLNLGIVQMEYTYWQRGLDSYTQVMKIVDDQIGNVVNAIPKAVRDNTIIVFASDHGEYAGAHGIVQGKMATLYREAWHIPLIVVDPSGRFADDTGKIRDGFVSSVDLLPMLVSLGNMGTRDWMEGPLERIYGNRHDIIPMLKSADAPGRDYVLHATDEIAPGVYNFNSAPTHVVGIRNEETNFGIYSEWLPASSRINRSTAQLELYDYSTTQGQMELINIAKNNPRQARDMYQQMVRQHIPDELQEPLPPPYRFAQQTSKIAHLIYRAVIENYNPQSGDPTELLTEILGYGGPF